MWGGILAAVGAGFTGCGAGEPPPVSCELDAPECRRNALAHCDDAGVVVETPCDPGRCAVDAPVAQCVPANALPCDPATDVASCENGLIVECAPDVAYRLARDCGEGMLCLSKEGMAACAVLDGRPCSPSTFQPLCVGERRIECERTRGRLFESGPCVATP